MTTVSTATGQTLVSILNTINGVANMAVKTVDSVSSSVDMLDHYVQRAKIKQIESATVEDALWRKQLLSDAATSEAKRLDTLRKTFNNNPQGQKDYNETLLQLEALFKVETP